MRLEIPKWWDYAKRDEYGNLYLPEDADVPEDVRREYMEELEFTGKGWEL